MAKQASQPASTKATRARRRVAGPSQQVARDGQWRFTSFIPEEAQASPVVEQKPADNVSSTSRRVPKPKDGFVMVQPPEDPDKIANWAKDGGYRRANPVPFNVSSSPSPQKASKRAAEEIEDEASAPPRKRARVSKTAELGHVKLPTAAADYPISGFMYAGAHSNYDVGPMFYAYGPQGGPGNLITQIPSHGSHSHRGSVSTSGISTPEETYLNLIQGIPSTSQGISIKPDDIPGQADFPVNLVTVFDSNYPSYGQLEQTSCALSSGDTLEDLTDRYLGEILSSIPPPPSAGAMSVFDQSPLWSQLNNMSDETFNQLYGDIPDNFTGGTTSSSAGSMPPADPAANTFVPDPIVAELSHLNEDDFWKFFSTTQESFTNAEGVNNHFDPYGQDPVDQKSRLDSQL